MAGKLNVESVDDPPVSSRACMRRIVRRGAPHEYGVDRRAVWRIYVVEAPGDHSNMSAKETPYERKRDLIQVQKGANIRAKETQHECKKQNNTGAKGG